MKMNYFFVGLVVLLWFCNVLKEEEKISEIFLVNMCLLWGLVVDVLVEIEGMLLLFEGLGDYSFFIIIENELVWSYFE